MPDDKPDQWLAAPALDDVEDAALALKGVGVETPLLESAEVNEGLSGRFKIAVEPGAAVGLAAVLHKKIDIKGKTIAVVTTGGNVDAASYCTALGAVAGQK